jgi:hypothetical protein
LNALLGRIADIATMGAIRTIGIVLLKATAINAGPGYAAFAAALPAFAIVKFVVIWPAHLFPL